VRACAVGFIPQSSKGHPAMAKAALILFPQFMRL
jgi:hypothetical protein